MKGSHPRWVNWTARVYYVIGCAYYVYHWLITLGLTGLAAVGVLNMGPVISSTVTTVSIITIIAGISFWRRMVRIQFTSLNSGLHITEMTIDYEYKNPTECHYMRSLKVRALRPVDRYRSKFKWSSEGDITEDVVRGAKKVTTSDHSTSAFSICQVDFARPLVTNESLEFTYILHLRCAKRTVKQYLGHTVDAPIDKLIMKVRLGEGCIGTAFRKQLFINSTGECPLKEDIVEITQYERDVEWHIPNAQAGYYYQISW